MATFSAISRGLQNSIHPRFETIERVHQPDVHQRLTCILDITGNRALLVKKGKLVSSVILEADHAKRLLP